jgi:hypothetical protein
MPVTPEARRRLAQLMDARRLDLRLRWNDVAAASGMSAEGLRAIRRGAAVPRDLNQRGIEEALQWPKGTIAGILDEDSGTEQDAETFLLPSDPPSFRRIMADPDPALTEQEKRGLVIWGRELIRRRAEERAEAERRGA